MKVSDIMTEKVIAIPPDTRIDKVASLLFDHNLTGMPVVDAENTVIGIVTEYDLMSPELKVHIPTYINFLQSLKVIGDNRTEIYKEEARKLTRATVDQIMTKEVITVHPDTDVKTLVDLISEHRINPVPVVDGAMKLVGIVSRADLVKILKESNFV